MAEPKPTGLGAFRRQPNGIGNVAPKRSARVLTLSANEKAGYKAVTVRFSVDDWERIKAYCLHQRNSIQRVLIDAMDRELQSHGLKGLETNSLREER